MIHQANMRTGRSRKKCFGEVIGWPETEEYYANASVILITYEKTFANKNKSTDKDNLLAKTRSADTKHLQMKSAYKEKKNF